VALKRVMTTMHILVSICVGTGGVSTVSWLCFSSVSAESYCSFVADYFKSDRIN